MAAPQSKPVLSHFVVREEMQRPGVVLGAHFHDRPMLTLVLQGYHEELLPRATFALETLDVVAKPAGVAHTDRVGKMVGRALIAEIRPGDWQAAGIAIERLEPVQLRSQETRHLVRRAASEWRRPDPFAGLALEAALLDLILIAARFPKSPGRGCAPPAWFRRAEEYLRDSFARSITLEDVADHTGVHPAHLARAFRRWRGTSVGDAVRELRVEAAARYIVDSDLPLGEVAARTGFSDQSHMGRHIRGRYRMAPGALRRAARCHSRRH